MLERDSTRGAAMTDQSSSPAQGKVNGSVSGSATVGVRRDGPHDRVLHGWLVRSMVVLAEVGIAFLIREMVAHREPNFAPFITFYPAVLLACLLDGIWAGIAVTVLATMVSEIWIFAPLGSLRVYDPYDILSLGIFFTFGISLSIVVELYHRNREKLATYLVDQAVSQERDERRGERTLAERVKAERQ